MDLTDELKNLLLTEAVERFLSFIKIWTTSDENSDTSPSTSGQLEFGKLLARDLKDLGVKEVVHDKNGFVYGSLPPSVGCEEIEPIGFMAHLDTSPAVNGKDVKPIIHEKYDGSTIYFEKNSDLTLTLKDSPLLKTYIGLDIITSAGDTLLGADDKAGIAEILAACKIWNKFPEIKHGPIIICFNPDEEIGKGTKNINMERLPKFCFTMDGSEIGQLEIECFDAWKAEIRFKGLSVHPGYAKGLMTNAIHLAARFLSEIPEIESPEHTEGREGFYHVGNLKGTEEEAFATLIIRDFQPTINQRRMEYLSNVKNLYERMYSTLKIELTFTHQYENMLNYLKKEDKVINLAKKAIEMTGLELKIHSIRGGTDGAKLSAKGIPTPNIFTGGVLFHSRKEYIPTIALQKAAEVILRLAELWTLE